jgi:hypothetical protein
MKALHSAVAQGDIETTRKLLERGNDPNELDSFDRPILFTAIQQYDPTMVHLLLQYGADPNKKAKGIPPLHFLARSSGSTGLPNENLITIAYLLIEYGANPERKNIDGLKAINRAKTDFVRDFLSLYNCKRKTRKNRKSSSPKKKPVSSKVIPELTNFPKGSPNFEDLPFFYRVNNDPNPLMIEHNPSTNKVLTIRTKPKTQRKRTPIPHIKKEGSSRKN